MSPPDGTTPIGREAAPADAPPDPSLAGRLLAEALALLGEIFRFARRQAAGAGRLLVAQRVDVAAMAGVGLAGAVFALLHWSTVDHAAATRAFDVWFQADLPRISESLTDRSSWVHYRSAVHPLFPLLVSSPFIVLAKLGLSPAQIAGLFVALCAFVFAAMLYATLRVCGLRRPDAALVGVLAATSAGGLFWLAVPETFALGASTLLLSLLWLGAPRGAHDAWTGPLQAAASIAITVTNGMAGAVAAVLGLGVRRGVHAVVIGFAMIALLTPLQYLLYPEAGRFLNIREEVKYLNAGPGADTSPWEVLRGIFSHALVAPDFAVLPYGEGTRLSFQAATVPLSPLAVVALAGWAVLLGLGLKAALARRVPAVLAVGTGVILLGQVLLHLLYGGETFLYALNFTCLFALVAGWACLERRRFALAVIVVTAAASYLHNARVHAAAVDFVNAEQFLPEAARTSERDLVKRAMAARPNDPWPDGRGHLVIAVPGSPMEEKGYLEPGGSFSPRPGGPGLSLWVRDARGRLVATSDAAPPGRTRHRFVRLTGDAAPAVEVFAPAYALRWRQIGPAEWRLSARPATAEHTPVLSVRAVGPAAGPIRRIVASDAALTLDRCWTVSAPGARLEFLGEEGGWRWTAARHWFRPAAHESRRGWAAARLAGRPGQDLEVVVRETCRAGAPARWPADGGAKVLPADSPIAALIADQSSLLAMGLVGDQTRPGDPINYPLQWQRDGAYVVVALARAGRVDAARDLVRRFARDDFFGGFGAEADAPGLALWAMAEVARAADDPALEAELWPYVRRKADLIVQLSTAREPVRRAFTGPVVPGMEDNPDLQLVAEPARDGLIWGRMDWHRPVLFVNAVSWRGLTDAAELARRSGHAEQAAGWSAAADRLRAAWRREFARDLKTGEAGNPRAIGSALWPSGIAAEDTARLRALLAATETASDKRPPWTYFEVARAHQHLRLGRPEAAWRRIDALTAASPFPALGVLWEGDGEENGFGVWKRYRGWVEPAGVTPHYWSAAELLLFGISCLAYVDETGRAPRLVIGGGLKPEWLTRPVSVEGIFTEAGPVSWRWDGETVRVRAPSSSLPLALAPGFPKSARIERVAGFG